MLVCRVVRLILFAGLPTAQLVHVLSSAAVWVRAPCVGRGTCHALECNVFGTLLSHIIACVRYYCQRKTRRTRESERIYIIARSTVTRSSRLSSTSALLMFRTVRPILPEVSEGNHFQKLALSTGHCKQYSGNSAWRHTHRRKHTRWQSLLETVWFVCSSRRGRVTALHCRDVCKCFMV